MKKTTLWVNLSIIAVLLITVLFASTTRAQAYQVDTDGRVAADEVIDDDLLLSGDNIVMNGKVMGTLIATGQTVVINGTVEGDVLAFGQTVSIGQGAQIKGNLFSGAQNVNVAGKVLGSVFTGTMSTNIKSTASIERNLYFGGYSLYIAQDAMINRDLAAGGYQVILDGTVARDVKANSAAIRVKGTVGRDFDVTVAEPSKNSSGSSTPYVPQADVPETLNPGLIIEKGAAIGGNLSYTSPIPQDSSILTQPSGAIQYRTPVPDTTKTQVDTTTPTYRVNYFFSHGVGKTLADMTHNFLFIMLVGILLLWQAPKIMADLLGWVRSKPMPSLGYGALIWVVSWPAAFAAFLAVIAVSALLFFITLGGWGLASFTFGAGSGVIVLIMTGLKFVTSFGSKVLIAYLIGDWLLHQMVHQAEVSRYVSLLVGAILLVVACAIPVLGWLITAVVVFMGLGALWLLIRGLRKPAVVAAPVQ